MQPTIIEVLKKDHRTVEKLFADIKSARTVGEKKGILYELISEFEAHSSGEEMIVYPVLKDNPELSEEAQHSYAEHDKARDLIKELSLLSEKDQKWESTLRELNEAIDQHVQEEERSIFPKMQQVFMREKLVELGEDFEATKQRLAIAS